MDSINKIKNRVNMIDDLTNQFTLCAFYYVVKCIAAKS